MSTKFTICIQHVHVSKTKTLQYWACIWLSSIIIPNCADCYQSYLSSKIALAKLLCLTVSVCLAEFLMFLLCLITTCFLLFLVLFTRFSKEPQKANGFTRKAMHFKIAIASLLLQLCYHICSPHNTKVDAWEESVVNH